MNEIRLEKRGGCRFRVEITRGSVLSRINFIQGLKLICQNGKSEREREGESWTRASTTVKKKVARAFARNLRAKEDRKGRRCGFTMASK